MRTRSGCVLALLLVGQLTPSPVLAQSPAERPSDAIAPVDIAPVELPAPTEPSEPSEPDTDEPPLDIDTDEPPLDIDTDTDEPLDADVAPIEDDYDVLRDSADARDARRWTRAGIASTVAGAVLIVGGVIMGTSDPCDGEIGNNCFRDARDRAALTMGVPGGALLLGGVGMIVAGELQKKRLRAQLVLSRERIGIGISGRF
jgi:hypothetical protein